MMASAEETRVGTPNEDRAQVRDGDDRSSLSSDDDAQAGVKNIEAISQTWTKGALVSAYIGSVGSR